MVGRLEIHMAGRKREARLRTLQNRRPVPSPKSTIPLPETKEEISICDAVKRLLPDINPVAILESLREEAEKRRARLASLRRMIPQGQYHVEPGAVAAAILLEGDLLLQ